MKLITIDMDALARAIASNTDASEQEARSIINTVPSCRCGVMCKDRGEKCRFDSGTFTPAHAEWEGRQVFVAAAVGSWPWLRGCINGIPKREEFIGGQRTRYVSLDEVLGWIDEGERRTASASLAALKGVSPGEQS